MKHEIVVHIGPHIDLDSPVYNHPAEKKLLTKEARILVKSLLQSNLINQDEEYVLTFDDELVLLKNNNGEEVTVKYPCVELDGKYFNIELPLVN